MLSFNLTLDTVSGRTLVMTHEIFFHRPLKDLNKQDMYNWLSLRISMVDNINIIPSIGCYKHITPIRFVNGIIAWYNYGNDNEANIWIPCESKSFNIANYAQYPIGICMKKVLSVSSRYFYCVCLLGSR